MTHGEHTTYTFSINGTAGRWGGLEVVTEKTIPAIDPLTCKYFDLWRVLYERTPKGHDFDCDCGRPEAALHSELCGVTPIYVSVCRDLGQWRHITLPFVEAMMSARTVVRTEEDCGRCDGNCEPWQCPLEDDSDAVVYRSEEGIDY